jgi:hypothetical protein
MKTAWVFILAAASACVFPERRPLPEMHVQLLDGSIPVREAKVGYSLRRDQQGCDQSLKLIKADDQGQFVLPARSEWGIGAITPIPDWGRPGWQLCFETTTSERRYFSMWAEPNALTTVRCDVRRPRTVNLCEVISVQ